MGWRERGRGTPLLLFPFFSLSLSFAHLAHGGRRPAAAHGDRARAQEVGAEGRDEGGAGAWGETREGQGERLREGGRVRHPSRAPLRVPALSPPLSLSPFIHTYSGSSR